MAIKVNDILEQCRELIDDDEVKSEYYKDVFWIRGLNSAVRQVYKYCFDATEYAFLLNTNIVISSTDVTNAVRSYALPARTIYVSNYCDARGNTDLDLRPLLKAGNDTTGSRLIYQNDYTLDGNNIVLISAPTTSGNIEVNYKQIPARIKKITEDVPILPDFFEDFLVEYCIWYSQRRLEDGNYLNNRFLESLALEARGILTAQSGRLGQFEPSWPADPDY
jgi:hypothetical protein